jgi:stage II sporulation protein R
MRKYIYIGIAAFFAFLVLLAFLPGKSENAKTEAAEYIRIHIRANSNSGEDQGVKYSVKEELIKYLTPRVLECETRGDARAVISRELRGIADAAAAKLKASGFAYGARAELLNEYFPTRSYDGEVLDSGYYDALIVYLGEGAGDNWWCVVYPPLCFVGSDYINGEGVRYKSKLRELIERIAGQGN